jgi:hypothetical protein
MSVPNQRFGQVPSPEKMNAMRQPVFADNTLKSAASS